MVRLVLAIIAKNEEHCILTMLNSAVKDVCDMVVINDTGSTDRTREVVREWGEKTGIPTYVVDRPFDNFCNSRNHAMEVARQKVTEHGWSRNQTLGMWLDCDETLHITPGFNKQKMDKQLYMMNTFIGSMKYTRNTFWNMSESLHFYYYGPVHEFIMCKEQNISSGLAENIHVDVKMIGASWKGDISQKYLKHAFLLEEYINYEDRNSRWVFYLAQSYHDSSSSSNKEENEKRLLRAMSYYTERVNTLSGYEEERFYSQYRIGTIKLALEYPWAEVHQDLMKAAAMEPLRCESLKIIIDHYLAVSEYHLAYLYAKSAKATFHGQNPYPNRLLFVDESLYNWRLLESVSACCAYTNRKEEAKENFNEILRLVKTKPEWFNQDDLNKINMNAQFFK